jgi:hypothetical protein
MRLERKDGDPELLAYPNLKFESAWELRKRDDLAELFLVFSGRSFECGGLTLEEVSSLPPHATLIPFRDDCSNRQFDRPPSRFVGSSILHVATYDADRWLFLDGGHLIYWGTNCYIETLNEAYHDEIVIFSETEFLDDSERADWPIDIAFSDLAPTPIRFLDDRQ